MVFLRLENVIDSNGEYIKSEQSTHLMDTVLLIISQNNNITVNGINLQLRHCGFFATLPTLNAILQYLLLKGYIKAPIDGQKS